MENLPVTLDKLLGLLSELEGTLTQEIAQLSQAQVNPVSLQIISDNKSRLITAINYYDELRKEEEKPHQLSTPYAQTPALAMRWQAIVHVVQKSAQLNQQSYQLLEMHMKKVNGVKKIINQTTATAQLYGESGNRSQDSSGHVYRISV